MFDCNAFIPLFSQIDIFNNNYQTISGTYSLKICLIKKMVVVLQVKNKISKKSVCLTFQYDTFLRKQYYFPNKLLII